MADDLLSRRAAKKRAEKAKDDGVCEQCGRYRSICSPYGQPCIFEGEIR